MINKKSLTVSISLALLTAFTACTTVDKSQGAKDLFNGKDLKGWKYVLADSKVKMEDVWSVQDGAIICKGDPIGYIYQDVLYTNFKLEVEYRWAPGKNPGNSGIFSRINGQPRSLPRCVEAQLKHGSAGDILTLQGMNMSTNQPRSFFIKNHALAGDVAGVNKLEDKEAKPGEWNKVEIVAKGSQYTVSMNGQKINEAKDIEITPGPIGLQSEGGEIHFRRVAITPLP